MKSLETLLLSGWILAGACWAQSQAPAQPVAKDRPPLLRCNKARFLLENSQPMARETVGFMWMQVDLDKEPGPKGSHVGMKSFKNLKTNANGEISVPNVKGGPYLLQLFVHETEVMGTFLSASNQESCLQTLEVRGKQILAKP
jgi:hypothetical protein